MRNCYNDDFKEYGKIKIKLKEYLDNNEITRNALYDMMLLIDITKIRLLELI